jgi:transcriptional regulator
MYIPAAFAETDIVTIHQFMRRNSFATVVSNGPHGMVASHLPILLAPDVGPNGSLVGHMARANRHWQQAQGEVLVIFSGPHTYVSPSWYEEGGTVPTWNYVAVHAYGTFQIVEEREDLLNILRRSVRAYEGSRLTPWVFDESASHVESMLKAIVGFRIEITRLEGKWKLSQNHPDTRRHKVIAALRQEPGEDAAAIADLMIHSLSGAETTTPRPDRSEKGATDETRMKHG